MFYNEVIDELLDGESKTKPLNFSRVTVTKTAHLANTRCFVPSDASRAHYTCIYLFRNICAHSGREKGSKAPTTVLTAKWFRLKEIIFSVKS